MATTALSMSFLVGGCGGGTDAYCEDLGAAGDQFAAFDSEQPSAEEIEEAISTFRDLGEQAPDEVSGDWDVFLGAFDDLESALEDAGIGFGDLADIQAGELPEGLDEQALQDLTTEIQSLGGEEIDQASQAIEEHASSECDVDLSGS